MKDEPLSIPDGPDANEIPENESEITVPGAIKSFLKEVDQIAHSDEEESPHILEFKDFVPRMNQEPEM